MLKSMCAAWKPPFPFALTPACDMLGGQETRCLRETCCIHEPGQISARKWWALCDVSGGSSPSEMSPLHTSWAHTPFLPCAMPCPASYWLEAPLHQQEAVFGERSMHSPATGRAADASPASGADIVPGPGAFAALSRARAASREVSTLSSTSSSISSTALPSASVSSAGSPSSWALLKCSCSVKSWVIQHASSARQTRARETYVSKHNHEEVGSIVPGGPR